jgi:microcystin-dependent protein
MSAPFLAEIRAFGFNFAPKGWAFCDGQTLSISQNTALFSLLGTTYGGDGKTTFSLPNMQGLLPIGQGEGPGLSAYDLGEQGGSDFVTLVESELPTHSHAAQAIAAAGTSASPTSNLWAEPWVPRGRPPAYSNATGTPIALNPVAVGNAGGGQSHENRPPLLVVNFCIALQGIFPARN